MSGIKLGVLELRIVVTLFVWSFEMRKTPVNLSCFNGHDVNTHKPKQTHLRLSGVKREVSVNSLDL